MSLPQGNAGGEGRVSLHGFSVIPRVRPEGAMLARVEAWIKALRGGDYTQATGYLHENDGFCCLGVACDLVDPTKWKAGDSGHVYSFYGSAWTLPSDIKGLYGLPSEGGFDVEREEDCLDQSIADLNDEGIQFSIIADLIEAFYQLQEASR